ncbi:MAG TPA: DfrA family trimethoprim-resistant dihydrofolate reductase [Bacteroidetes bacterium]|nr:DfrA family trimethoprim-resistant dihydrofolate reductase [Bacteroidota bacterium]|tara:strand:- start:938 stop:1471 length:534 start_codon:yes stop_codon:yes gene_type:complete
MMIIPKYTLVAALGQNNELGDGKDLLWRLPEDLKFFKKATLGGLVIMGRKTYESLPLSFRPLPGRENIVLTRQKSWSMEGVTALHSWDAIHDYVRNQVKPAFIIGGGQLYDHGLSIAQTLLLTRVNGSFDQAAVFFPTWNEKNWSMEVVYEQGTDDKHAYSFVIERWERMGSNLLLQ